MLRKVHIVVGPNGFRLVFLKAFITEGISLAYDMYQLSNKIQQKTPLGSEKPLMRT